MLLIEIHMITFPKKKKIKHRIYLDKGTQTLMIEPKNQLGNFRGIPHALMQKVILFVVKL